MPVHTTWSGLSSDEVATDINEYLDGLDLYVERIADRSGHHEWEIDIPFGITEILSSITLGRIWVEDDDTAPGTSIRIPISLEKAQGF